MNRKEIKSNAWGLMKTGSPKPLYVTIVYVVILIAFSFLSFKLVGEGISGFFNSFSVQVNLNDPTAAPDDKMAEQFLLGLEEAIPGPLPQLLNTALKLLSMVIGAGFIIFLLRTISGEGAAFGNLFDGFSMFFRIVWLYILEGIFIFLWGLLFIVPGFIAFYRYRMAIYLRLERPELTAMQCIDESKRLMSGYKAELFVLDLSFIVWYLAIGVINSVSTKIGIVILGTSILGYVIQCWLLPYKGLSCALFYKKRIELDASDNAGFFDEPADFPEF